MLRNLSLSAIITLLLVSTSVFSQSSRTFVSGSGIDVGSCTISAPCRSFSAALAAVADGGDIIVLSSAGYGQVTINKSVSILVPDGLYAGITAPTGDGVRLSGTGLKVNLRGLTLIGNNQAQFTSGIRCDDPNSRLRIERTFIRGFQTGVGISQGYLILKDSTIAQTKYGVVIGGNQIAMIDNCLFENNDDGITNSPAVQNGAADIANCTFSGNQSGVRIWIDNPAASSFKAQVTRCRFGGNSSALTAHGISAMIRVAESTITKNLTALGLEGGQILSHSSLTNTVEDNLNSALFSDTYEGK